MIVAINKMDLVDYSEERYNEIKLEFEKLVEKSDYEDQNITFIPVSALKGDNVVKQSAIMSWYKDQTLIEHLEELDSKDIFNRGRPRFPVQYVIRPQIEKYHDYRGYGGRIDGGIFRVGDKVKILPSGFESKS